MMSAALFTRRSRSGWLDELDGLRDDALAQPTGEVSMAMAGAPPVAETDHDTSPLTVLEAPLPPAATRSASPERDEPSESPMPSADPPPSAALPPAGLRPLRLVAVATSASAPEPDPSPAPEPSGPVWVPPTVPAATRPATRPAPHPVRPQEMWHPGVVAVPPPPVVTPPVADEQIHPADLDGAGADGDGSSSRFRFARLRPVLSGPGPRRAGDAAEKVDADEATTDVADTDADVEPPYSLLEDLLAPYGAPPVEEDTGPVGHGSAPLVPMVAAGANRTLITGPVIRRTERDDEFIRRRDLQATLESDRVAGHRPAGDEGPSTDGEVAENADLSAWVDPATDTDPEPIPARRRLSIADDRTVAVDGGHLRLADHAECEIHGHADGVEVELLDGWCWTAVGLDAATAVVVTLPVGRLTVPPGATALAVVEVDRTGFVVVVAGEAALEHSGGRVRLRPCAMVLVPLGCNPQVDVASRDEIQADPLVSRNQSLDAQR